MKKVFFIVSTFVIFIVFNIHSAMSAVGGCSPPCESGKTCVNGICITVGGCSPPCESGKTCVNGVCIDNKLLNKLPNINLELIITVISIVILIVIIVLFFILKKIITMRKDIENKTSN